MILLATAVVPNLVTIPALALVKFIVAAHSTTTVVILGIIVELAVSQLMVIAIRLQSRQRRALPLLSRLDRDWEMFHMEWIFTRAQRTA